MSKTKLEVTEWQPSAAAVAANTPRYRPERWSPTAVGILGTVLLHSLILEDVMLGSRASMHRTQDTHNFAAPGLSGASLSETVLLLDLPAPPQEAALLAQTLAALAPSNREMRTAPLSVDPPPTIAIREESDNTNSTAVIDSGNAAAQVAMFGRYTGQIDARIERAWRRPRSAVNGSPSSTSAAGAKPSPLDLFDCQVRILQDTRGAIQEVQLLRCNGSVAWQQSLVTAILSSSPLPAPPTPTVFTPAIVMRFTAFPYTPDRSPDEYELPSSAVANND